MSSCGVRSGWYVTSPFVFRRSLTSSSLSFAEHQSPLPSWPTPPLSVDLPARSPRAIGEFLAMRIILRLPDICLQHAACSRCRSFLLHLLPAFLYFSVALPVTVEAL